MGRRLKAKTITLRFSGDSDLDGLEATFRRPKMNELMALTEAETNAESTAEKVKLTIDLFGALLTEWNQEDEDGNPLPASAEGLGHLDDEEFGELLSSYTNVTGGVPDPLEQGSSNGSRSPEASSMMELSSMSRPN
jgi:hypothetical protein